MNHTSYEEVPRTEEENSNLALNLPRDDIYNGEDISNHASPLDSPSSHHHYHDDETPDPANHHVTSVVNNFLKSRSLPPARSCTVEEECDSPRELLTINVGGMRFQTWKSTLNRFPDTLLGRLISLLRPSFYPRLVNGFLVLFMRLTKLQSKC
eukprot:sb/3473340/